MFRFSPCCPSLLCYQVLFGFDPEELLVVPRIFVYIFNVCKFLICLARNNYRFHVRPGAAPVIENVICGVSFNLPLYFKCFRSSRRRCYFRHQWGAQEVIVSVDGAPSPVNIFNVLFFFLMCWFSLIGVLH